MKLVFVLHLVDCNHIFVVLLYLLEPVVELRMIVVKVHKFVAIAVHILVVQILVLWEVVEE
jgi:hypothetical protein